VQLPPELASVLDEVLGSVPEGVLRRAAQELSRRYRAGAPGAALVRSDEDALAYVAYRLPATYAALSAALRRSAAQLCDLHPATLLDAGAGPGTALWAARAVYGTIRTATLIERDARMAALGRRLGADALADVRWLASDLAADWQAPPADLVCAAFVLGELPGAARDDVLMRLWSRTQGVLLLVEPGTPEGHDRIARARALLLQQGARTVAPCPHDLDCPLAPPDWCHFAQRVERTRIHRRIKGELPYEDEKFAYAALTPLAPQRPPSRVIRRPELHGGHLYLGLCEAEGTRTVVVSRRDKEAWRAARGLAWGDPGPRPPDRGEGS